MYMRVQNPNLVLFKVFTIWQMRAESKIVAAPLFDELFNKMSFRSKHTGVWINEQVPLYRKAFNKIVDFSRLRRR